MKNIALFAAIFAGTAFSLAIEPITAFQPATYLVSGSSLVDGGKADNYASFITFQSNGWHVTQFRNNALYYYENVVDIDANGFFSIQLTDSSNASSPVVYNGQGNCGTAHDQYSVNLSNGVLHKTMIFDATMNLTRFLPGFITTMELLLCSGKKIVSSCHLLQPAINIKI